MNASGIQDALRTLGMALATSSPVDVLLVGGAAGMLTGVLPRSRVTSDCDVIAYNPPSAFAKVELAAAKVAQELGLAPTWLNSDVHIRADALPAGAHDRRILIGVWGGLRVWGASRIDLIAMKVLAGRAQDLEDLRSLQPTRDDGAFVRTYLDQLDRQGAAADQTAEARRTLEALEFVDG